MIRAFLLRARRSRRGHAAAGRIGMAREVFDDAEMLLEAVLERCARLLGPRAANMPRCCSSRHKYAEAAERARPAARGGARPIASYRTLARHRRASASASTSGRSRFIADCCSRRRRTPDAAICICGSRHALKTLGRRPRGDRGLSRRRRGAGRISAMPIGASPTSRPTASRTRRSRACAPRKPAPATSLVDRYHLCFALGKALEDRGEYAESWRYYERGNALKRAESRYRPEIIETNTAPADRGLHRANSSQRRAAGACADPDPIFIVGLPRSGSTLLEQILASHSAGRGHAGARRHPAHRRSNLQGREPDLERSALSGRRSRDMRRAEFRRLGGTLSRRHARLSHRQAASSSTRCRTISGTSG